LPASWIRYLLPDLGDRADQLPTPLAVVDPHAQDDAGHQHDLHRLGLGAPRAPARGRAELDDRRCRRRRHGTRFGRAFTREATLPAVQPLLIQSFLLGKRAHRQP
jgi:hypothetical protein